MGRLRTRSLPSRIRVELRRRSPAAFGRRRALGQEVRFWREWLRTGGLEWPEEYRARVQERPEVDDPMLRHVIAELGQSRVAILDVGSGPFSVVGVSLEGYEIALTAADPLAAEYQKILDEAGVEPAVRSQPVRGEELLSHFGGQAFDIAFARNALDHTVDPRVVVENMIAVVRLGGYVALRHVPNEALTEGYGQLHNWNITEEDGRCIFWRTPEDRHDLASWVGERGDVTCYRDQLAGYEWICCAIRLRTTAEVVT